MDKQVTVVHVQEGSQYRAFIRILRQVCVAARSAEVLPDVPPQDAGWRYVLLRAADQLPDYTGEAFYRAATPLPGLLLRRARLHKPLSGGLVLLPIGARQKQSFRVLRRRGAAPDWAVCRPALLKRPRKYAAVARLTPVALPTAQRAFLDSVREAVIKFNGSAAPAQRLVVLPSGMLRCAVALIPQCNSCWCTAVPKRKSELQAIGRGCVDPGSMARTPAARDDRLDAPHPGASRGPLCAACLALPPLQAPRAGPCCRRAAADECRCLRLRTELVLDAAERAHDRPRAAPRRLLPAWSPPALGLLAAVWRYGPPLCGTSLPYYYTVWR